ncbi:MAG: RDD family protein [Actinobacteria bacterium]|nr:RDD family protein [Actinomycetota bacterium]MCG2800658.1 RDD family protein [Cellulomonas sp.]
MTTQGILTGEGVLLEAEPASFASRMLGAALDYSLAAAVLVAALTAADAVGSASGSGGRIAVVVAIVTVLVLIPVTVETLSRGRSLGRLASGVRIVRDDGGPVTVRHALIRALIGVIELWLLLGIPALLASIASPRGKRLGDMVAGTYAVRVRGGPSGWAPLTMPTHLVGWAQHADVARLPDSLALAARQFLGRAPRLNPASRAELGSRLTTQVLAYVHPWPPAGTHPESFLAAVLAERRERELATEQTRTRRAHLEADAFTRLPYGVPDPTT